MWIQIVTTIVAFKNSGIYSERYQVVLLWYGCKTYYVMYNLVNNTIQLEEL